MNKKWCASISDLWTYFDVLISLRNIGLFILGCIVLPFAYLYVKVNNLIYKMRSK